MRVSHIILLLFSLVGMVSCQSSEEDAILPARSQEVAIPELHTPVPLPNSYLEPIQATSISRVWVHSGGDKVTRDELRAARDPGKVLSSVWDGGKISLFGARNEVVSFNLVLEAPASQAENVEVVFSALVGPGDFKIEGQPAEGEDLFWYLGRDIELFYIDYLEIRGISTDLFFAGYDYDERHLPVRCRRPYDQDGQGTGGWNDRPCHNLFYPEIAVPLELHTPFDVAAGSNQSVWSDIYIPKSVPAGRYMGEVSILEDGYLVWEIPIELQVYDFELPDLPRARTMLYISAENLADRYFGKDLPVPGSEAYKDLQVLLDRHFQLAHRHKISLFDSYTPLDHMDDTWKARLDGSLFTAEQGYAGVGEGIGNNVYVVGAYGEWPWKDGSKEDMWAQTDAWMEWIRAQELTTPTELLLYLVDESEDYDQIETWAQWINENPGPGGEMMSMATIDLPIAAEFTPSLDIPTSWARIGIREQWEPLVEEYASDPERAFYMYNSNRPVSGSFAIEDDGTALRELAWGQYKKRVDRWLYWESTYYENFQCANGLNEAHTDVYQQAQTFGCLDGLDDVFGETGWNYLNGDGVLFYPGTEMRFPEENYGVLGPFASLRLKHWRRGIQDVDYLALAEITDPERTADLVERMIPEILWEMSVEEREDPTYLLSDSSWPANPDLWEEARAELALIITDGPP
ncbi:MAG: DUF4091 domain-containing protein [Anaerolineales bacterium]|jgi:hypothetical protein